MRETAGGHVTGDTVSNGAQWTSKRHWVHPGEAKPWEDCLQDTLLQLCFLLLAASVFLLYLAWCEYYMKGSHCSQDTVSVSWENPTPCWAVYLQIVMKMILIRAMTIS